MRPRAAACEPGAACHPIVLGVALLVKRRAPTVFFGLMGKAMMSAGLAWAAYMVWLQKAKLSDSPLAESDESKE